MTANNHCLLCQAHTWPITKGVNEHGEEVDVKIERLEEQHNISFLCKSGSDSGEIGIVEHLKSIFIVRKLLDIPPEVCEKYLQWQDGNFHPKSWFSVCSECDDIVRKCFDLERKIRLIQKELEEEKSKLKAIICESERKPGDELVSPNLYITNEIRKHVFGKESATMDSPPCNKSTGKNFVRSPISPLAPRRRPRRRRLAMTQRKRKGVRRKTKASGVKAEQLSDEHFSPPDLRCLTVNCNPDSNFIVNADEAETMEYEIEAKPESITGANSSTSGKEQLERTNPSGDNMEGLKGLMPSMRKLPLRRTKNSKSTNAGKDLSDSDLEDSNHESDFPHSPGNNVDSDWVPSDSDVNPIKTKESNVEERRPRKFIERKRELEICEDPEVCKYSCPECPAKYRNAHIHLYSAHLQLHKNGAAALACPLCGWFIKRNNIKRHGLRHHPQEMKRYRKEIKKIPPKSKLVYKRSWHGRKRFPFYCEYCPMIYTSDSFLSRHVNTCHPDHAVYQCSFCTDNFVSKQILQLHIEVKHPNESTDPAGGSESGKKLIHGSKPKKEEVVPCLHCSETFNSILGRDYHIAKSHANILRTCKICGFQGTQRHPLGKHLQIKHKMYNLICPFCSKTYTAQSVLDMHLKQNHSEEIGVESIKCDQCPRTFMTEASLKNHIGVVHKKLKEHICEFCGKAFADKSYLKKHNLLHTETREKQYKAGPFFCKFCDAKFNVRQGLYYHMKNLHSDKYIYRCGKCGKGYEFRNPFLIHELKCTKVVGQESSVTPPKTTSAENAVNNSE